MKVGIDVSQAIYGTGVSDYVINLVSHLPKEILTLVGFSLRRQNDLKKIFPSCKTYPISPGMLHILWNKLHVFNFENFAPGNIDIYHSSDWTQAPDSSKKVTTIHDLTPFLYPHDTDPKIVATHTAKMKWVIKECDTIICVSKTTQADMHRLFPQTQNKTTVIYEALPERYNIKFDPPPKKNSYILAIGARQPRKNINTLIKAYSKYKRKYSLPEKLIIIGENHQNTTQSDIQFTGYIPDDKLLSYLGNAEAFVNPSLYEGFGLPILESFHLKTPVACSDIPVFREIAANSAEYFDPKDEEDIIIKILAAINKSKELVKKGEEQLKKYNWETAAKETIQVYKNLC